MSQNSDHRRLKFITGADPFGCALKDKLISHLQSLNIEIQDLGTDNYYTVAAKIGHIISTTATSPDTEIRGLVACGTGVGVSIFANKFPGVYAATCLTPADAVNARSISNCNVIAVSGMSTSPEIAIETLDKFINTPFKSPCPASNSEPWPENVQSFLDDSLPEMAKIGTLSPAMETLSRNCAICDLAADREFSPVEIMPGGYMKIVRETPTSAIVRFSGGSVEPAHHHSYGHDVMVMKGRKIVWNSSKKERYELGVGDFLYTPGGDVHRVKYLEDTEFFIRWDGVWDIDLDEDLDTANANIEKEV
ncbi:DNA damage-repair/toleration protein DRT102 [Rutidosis leptorrhynchoides]|uniref:DNA damage-repair/toleration protein DRT102 n=1 Tax=Rutidosis leptorrhynchoides TaxID=125765 RepID=UPI003A9A5CA4